MEFDLNIDNYKLDELYSLLNIPETSSESEIIQATKELKQEYSNGIDTIDGTVRTKYLAFFDDIQDTLLSQKYPNTRDYDEYHENQVIHRDDLGALEVREQTNDFMEETDLQDVNQIPVKEIKQTITIDSIFRNDYYNTNPASFTHIFPTPLNNVTQMKLVSIELPNVWYMFSSTNLDDRFTITVNNYGISGNKSTTHEVIIPTGNYTPEELTVIMNNYFTNIEDGLQYLLMEFNSYTGKMIIRANESFDATTNPKPYDNSSGNRFYSPNFNFTIDFKVGTNERRPLYRNAGWTLGFRKQTYTVTIDDTYYSVTDDIPVRTYRGYLESEGIFGSSINDYIYVSIEDYNKNYRASIIPDNQESFLGNSLIGRLEVPVSKFSVIVDDSSGMILKQRDYFGPINLEKIHVSIVDKYGEVVNLTNNDYSFTLEITSLYS